MLIWFMEDEFMLHDGQYTSEYIPDGVYEDVLVHAACRIETTTNLYMERLTISWFRYHNIVILCLSNLCILEFQYFNRSNKEDAVPRLVCLAYIPLF